MSLIPKPPAEANVLFGPDELRMYKRWRILNINAFPKDDKLSVPDAFENAAYQTWRAQQREKGPGRNYILTSDKPKDESDKAVSHEGFVRAEKCGHLLHPAHPAQQAHRKGKSKDDGDQEEVLHCPLCTMHLHKTLITAIFNAWKQLGAPYRAAFTDAAKAQIYGATNRAYHKARVALVNTMCGYEAMAEEEANWELANPDRDIEDDAKKHSATSALEEYKNTISFPAHLMEPDQTPQRTPKTPPPHRKNIIYTPDTPEDTQHRPYLVYNRLHTSHDPSAPHVCPSPEGYADTSFINDWHYAISQCRILLVRESSLSSSTELEYRDLNAGEDRGMTNPHVRHLIELWEHWLSECEEGLRNQWVSYLKQTGDMFLVWEDGDAGEDAFNTFERVGKLLGTCVEEYARAIGDIDDEEWAAHHGKGAGNGQGEEKAEAEPACEEEDLKMDSDGEREPALEGEDKDDNEEAVELADPMDLVDQEDDDEDSPDNSKT